MDQASNPVSAEGVGQVERIDERRGGEKEVDAGRPGAVVNDLSIIGGCERTGFLGTKRGDCAPGELEPKAKRMSRRTHAVCMDPEHSECLCFPVHRLVVGNERAIEFIPS